MSDASFEQAIFDHLALAERNRKLERWMPIDRYREQFGGGGAPVRRERPREAEPSALVPDVQWDTTSERPLPAFDVWDGG